MRTREKVITVFVASDDTEHPTQFACEQHERELREQRELSKTQQVVQELAQQHQMKVEEIGRFWEQHPECKVRFLEQLKGWRFGSGQPMPRHDIES